MRRLQRIKTWQLVILLILMSFIAATFLRLNNIGMIQRRDAVLQADKGTDSTVTQTRLYDLQRYVSSHMNAHMGTIYLESQYKRDTQKIIDSASSNTSYEDAKPFKDAQAVCAPRYANLGGYSQAYQQCVIDQLDGRGSSANLTTNLQLPKADQYRFSFAAPVWSPDFAGFSVLACIIIVLIIVGRLTALLLLKLIIKINHRGA
jgi:hypothetical protein